MTHGKVMLWVERSRHWTDVEDELQWGLSLFASPGEPWGTSGRSHSQKSPSSALWTSDSLCLETSTAWEIENNSTTSVDIMHITAGAASLLGTIIHSLHALKQLSVSVRQVHSFRWTQTATWNYRERLKWLHLEQVSTELWMPAVWKEIFMWLSIPPCPGP